MLGEQHEVLQPITGQVRLVRHVGSQNAFGVLTSRLPDDLRDIISLVPAEHFLGHLVAIRQAELLLLLLEVLGVLDQAVGRVEDALLSRSELDLATHRMSPDCVQDLRVSVVWIRTNDRNDVLGSPLGSQRIFELGSDSLARSSQGTLTKSSLRLGMTLQDRNESLEVTELRQVRIRVVHLVDRSREIALQQGLELLRLLGQVGRSSQLVLVTRLGINDRTNDPTQSCEAIGRSLGRLLNDRGFIRRLSRIERHVGEQTIDVISLLGLRFSRLILSIDGFFQAILCGLSRSEQRLFSDTIALIDRIVDRSDLLITSSSHCTHTSANSIDASTNRVCDSLSSQTRSGGHRGRAQTIHHASGSTLANPVRQVSSVIDFSLNRIVLRQLASSPLDPFLGAFSESITSRSLQRPHLERVRLELRHQHTGRSTDRSLDATGLHTSTIGQLDTSLLRRHPRTNELTIRLRGRRELLRGHRHDILNSLIVGTTSFHRTDRNGGSSLRRRIRDHRSSSTGACGSYSQIAGQDITTSRHALGHRTCK